MLKKFIHYVSLNVMAMVSISFLIFVDTFFIARAMGADGLTSLNLAIPIYSVVNGVGHMLGVGGGARFATLRAAGNKEDAQRVFTIAFLAGMLFSLLFMGLGIWVSEDIATLMGATGHIHSMTAAYIQTVLTLAPALVLSNTLASFIRNDGTPRVAMISTVILSVSNIVLDYIFIFPLGMGMFGAALATMIGSSLGLIYLLVHWWLGRSNLRFLTSERPLRGFGRIALTGMPSLIGDLSSAIVLTVFNLLILDLEGNVGVAVFGIVANLSLVVLAVFNGVGQGMQPLVSAAYGKHDEKGQKQVLKYAHVTVLGLALLTYGTAFLFTDYLTAIFNSGGDPLLSAMARYGVRIYFTGFIFVGITIITIIYLSITHAPKAAFILSLLRGGIIIVPMVLLLAPLLGITGVWLSYPLAEFLVMVAALIVYRKYNILISPRFPIP